MDGGNWFASARAIVGITLLCIFCERLMWSSGNDVISGMFASEAKGAQRLLLFVVTKHQ